MKVAETKPIATPAKAQTSFFNKGAEPSFFHGSVQRLPFFKKENIESTIQTKLRVGQINDSFEKEADNTADQVLQKLSNQKSTFGNQKIPIDHKISAYVQRKCESCESEKKIQKKEEKISTSNNDLNVQKKAEVINEDSKVQLKAEVRYTEAKFEKEKLRLKADESSNKKLSEEPLQRKCTDCEKELTKNTDDIERGLSASKGTGRPMSGPILKQMESSFGADFSSVRIHDNNLAIQMCSKLNAQAFAHGNDIYFNTGKYDPNSSTGIHLLAHELTHVIQQRGIKEKQVQLKGSHVNTLATPVAIAEPVISRKVEEEEDGFLLEAAKDGLWAILREASPEIHDIFRYKGFINWAKDKISIFISSTVNSLSTPIRLGASVLNILRANFDQFKVWLVSAVERLKQGDCTPFSEATQFITNILEGIAGPVLEKIKEFLRPIKAFIDMVWNDFGKPLWDFISRVFGNIWDSIKWVADKIWNHIKSIISVYADIWHWFARAIGFEGDDQDSLWEQVKRKVLDLWNFIKQKLEPYKTQLMVLAGIILLLSPAGPFIIAGAALTGILFLASKVRHYLNDRQAIIRERGYVNGVLIPALNNQMKSLANILKAKANMILASLRGCLIALQSISQDMGEIALLALNSIVNWLTDKFTIMTVWAEVQLSLLVTMMDAAFNRIKQILHPITVILRKVGLALADYYKLPFLVLDTLFHKIPKCIRDRIIAFIVKYVFKHIPILREVKDVEGAWAKMQKKAIKLIEMVFVHGDLMGALWEVFNLLLEALKFPKELAVKVFNKTFEVFDTIIEQPKVFFVNMLTTAKLGLIGFFERKWFHLKEGFTAWLFDAVKGSPIYIPRTFSFSEIFKMLGSLFSVGMDKVYKSIEKKRGAELAAKVRRWLGYISRGAAMAWSWVKALHENSLDETIDMIKAKGAELLQVLTDSVIDWIVSNIIAKVSAKLISMLDPTGVMAVVNSIVAFYNAVETAIEKAREILQLVENVLDNVADVMAGAFTKSAQMFEIGLQRAIPLFLEFLANQVSMGKIGKKIREMAKEAEKWIDDKIDRLVDRLLAAGDWLVETGKKAVDAFLGWWKTKVDFKDKGGENHELYFKGEEQNAELMVASNNPKPFVSFIKNVQVTDDKNKENAKKESLILMEEIKKITNAFPPQKSLSSEEKKKIYQDRKDRLKELMGQLSAYVADLISEKDLPDGSYENPIPIRWTKRGHMQTVNDLIPKDSLWKMKGMNPPDPIESASIYQKTRVEIPPTKKTSYKDKNKETGEGSKFIMIGVDAENFPDIGTKLIRNKKDGTSEKDRFRSLLVDNYYLDLNKYDVDHVKDLGFEGKDKVSNLWPLYRDLNQKWGTMVYNQPVVYKDKEGKMQVSKPMDLYKKWFIIKEIGDL